MKIAIVGAPGSGKSAFARKLSKELNIPVFDNEAQKFSKRLGFALGIGADYRTELMLLGHRLENTYKNWETEGIFTQTLVDSTAYQNIRKELNSANIFQKSELFHILDQEKEFHMTVLFAEVLLTTFNYDKVYHLKMFSDTTDTENNPEFFMEKIVEAAQTDILTTILNGVEIETVKRTPKVRRNKLEETE
jgi:GTPase SAR1 family protein